MCSRVFGLCVVSLVQSAGDIGQFLEDGSLSIVDRKKNLVKLLGGEYVALEKMYDFSVTFITRSLSI